MLRSLLLTILIAVCLGPAAALAETPSTAQVMATAAEAFISALDATQEEQATFSFDADERLN